MRIRPIQTGALRALRCRRQSDEVHLAVSHEGETEFVLALRSPTELAFLVHILQRCGREAWGVAR